MLTLWHEEFIADAAGTLERICEFLGLEAPADYLQARAAIVDAEPRRPRSTIDWSPAQLASIERTIDEFPFMARYREAEIDRRAHATPRTSDPPEPAPDERPSLDTGSGGGI